MNDFDKIKPFLNDVDAMMIKMSMKTDKLVIGDLPTTVRQAAEEATRKHKEYARGCVTDYFEQSGDMCEIMPARPRYGSFPAFCGCAHCGGENTHQIGVEIYDRKDDEPTCTYISVLTPSENGYRADTAPELTVAAYDDYPNDNNPSPRRQGVTIILWCETCPRFTALNVLQHKGITALHKTPYVGEHEATLNQLREAMPPDWI